MLPQRVLAEPGRQVHFDKFLFYAVAFGKASAANDSSDILLTDPHKRALIVYVGYLISVKLLKHEFKNIYTTLLTIKT